ncbi:hypothetical protein IP81_19505 [Novosphingobium sp. AAP83]|uniref:hypothetical protein n=1 Tax=Novosphingobium sp. AAP83 TaxID=1523425 RepID=UPI0006B94FB9|nr:hypothetical protein [Novosphingobium sp. AAP83]KPF85581.1 hypothetical protein IP81_19505 [Novosphingobium sp. AAP83]
MASYAERAASLRDEDLLEIAFSKERDGFDPVFIAVARKEVSRRKIDSPTQKYGSELQRQKELNAALDAVKHKTPLKRVGTLLFLFFSILVLPCLIVAFSLFLKGYNKKAKDALSVTLIGFPLWIAVIVIAGMVAG